MCPNVANFWGLWSKRGRLKQAVFCALGNVIGVLVK